MLRGHRSRAEIVRHTIANAVSEIVDDSISALADALEHEPCAYTLKASTGLTLDHLYALNEDRDHGRHMEANRCVLGFDEPPTEEIPAPPWTEAPIPEAPRPMYGPDADPLAPLPINAPPLDRCPKCDATAGLTRDELAAWHSNGHSLRALVESFDTDPRPEDFQHMTQEQLDAATAAEMESFDLDHVDNPNTHQMCAPVVDSAAAHALDGWPLADAEAAAYRAPSAAYCARKAGRS